MEPLPVIEAIASTSLANRSPPFFNDSKNRFNTPHIRKLNRFILPPLKVHLYLSYRFSLTIFFFTSCKSGLISNVDKFYHPLEGLSAADYLPTIMSATNQWTPLSIDINFHVPLDCADRFLLSLQSNWSSYRVKKLPPVQFNFPSKNPDKMPSFLTCRFVSISFPFLYK